MNILPKFSFSHLTRRYRLPIFVFLVSLILTLSSWQYSLHLDKLQAEQKFDKIAQDYQQNLSNRFNTYLQALVDLRGLFDSSQYISRTMFDAYMHSINLIQNFPGIRRIGYAPLVEPQEVAAFEARAQMKEFPNYRIKSPQKGTLYFPVLYTYPLTPQIQADTLGLNLAALQNRAAAMSLARDTNRPVVTQKISMPSDAQHSPAIGIYLPVYRHGALLRTITERRKALTGVVFEGFRVEDLLRGVFGQDFKNNIGLKIYDGIQLAPATLLYETGDSNGSAYRRDILRAKYVTSIKIADRTWTLAFSSKPGFFQANRSSTPAVILFSGLLTTLLMTGIAVQLSMRRRLKWSKEEQNQRFRSLFEQHPDAVYAFDLKGKFIDANEATAKLAGQSLEELLGKSFKDIVAPECRQTSSYRFDQARKGISQEGETDILTPSGKRLTLNISTLPIIVNGKITGIFGIAKNISEQKQTETRNRRIQKLLDTIIDNIPVMLFVKESKELRFVIWNKAGEELTGFSREQILNKTDCDLFNKEEADYFRETDWRVLESGKFLDIPVESIQTRSGIRLLHTKKVPFSMEGTQYLLGVSEDITEKKHAEEVLHESEARFRAIFEQAPMGIIQATLNNEPVRTNQKLLDILGYSSEEIRTKNILLDMTHPDDLVRSLEYERKIKAGELDRYSIEKRYIRIDGSIIWVHLIKTTIKTVDGKPQFLISIVEDISERKNAEEVLQRSHDELEDKVRERTEELNQANQTLKDLSSHLQMAREEERTRIAREVHDEMGGVLTAIKIDISMLKQQQEVQGQVVPPELDRTLGLVDIAVTSLRRIITDLRPSILDTMGLWAALEWQLQEVEKRTGVLCSFQMKGDECELDDDLTTAIFRVFQEALTNVARHAKATRLDVSGTANEAEIVITIKDNGIGIAKERRLNSKSFGILGMQERARIFNGSVQITSLPFKGTTVSIRFPSKRETD